MAVGGVTVAVVLYNGVEHLPYCLDAVSGLRGEIAEILVIDNGSTDGGPDWIRENRPEVRLVEVGENPGPCVARNRALQESRTARVFLLDCDVVPDPECLGLLTAEMEAHPDLAVVQPRALFAHDPARIHYDGGWFSYTGLLTLRNFGARVEETAREPIAVDAVISMALLVDRDRLRRVENLGNPFDDIYFIYFEDTDLSYRLGLAGSPLRLVPEATVLHREGTAGVSYRAGGKVAYRRAFLLSRNRWIFLLKTYAWRTFFLTLPAQIMYEVILAAFLTWKGQPHGYVLGKLNLMVKLPRILKRRRATQAMRRVRDRDLLGFEGFSFIPLLEGGSSGRGVSTFLDRVFALYWKWVRWLM